MRRFSIRARLTAAFAAALLLVMVLAGAFVYDRVGRHLNNTINDGLQLQSGDLTALVSGSHGLHGGISRNPDEGFSQILTPSGRVVASTLPRSVGPAIDPQQIRQASTGRLIVDVSAVPGVSGEVRILARPATNGGRPVVLLVGRSTDDRSEALTSLKQAFGIGAPIALVLASILGYWLAGRALAPVESMRRRAQAITLQRSGDRLPLPPANDEIHQLGVTLNSMLDRIEASLERERRFVADASHELRTPLATLGAELELAERPGRSAQELDAAVRSAKDEVDRLSRLAEDLLVIARSDQGSLPIVRSHVALEPLLERTRGRMARRAHDARRDIVVAAPPGIEADVDPVRIEQALANLVDNALRHGGGTVTLSAARDDGFVVVSVADDGPGFDPGFAEHAFERFSRADPGRSGGGAGLGLAIVRAIAEAHGGEVELDSGGNGAPTCLRMRMPVAAAEPPSG